MLRSLELDIGTYKSIRPHLSYNPQRDFSTEVLLASSKVTSQILVSP